MKPTAPIRRNPGTLLHPIARSAILLASSTLERTHNDRAGFVAALAHEIRNPLCTVNMAVDLLTMTDLDKENREYLNMIKRASIRINSLVNSLVSLDLPKEADAE